MVQYIPKPNDMEMWIICKAIGHNHELIDKMKKNSDGSYTVSFSVGGVELDFSKVAQRIDEEIQNMVTNKAQKLLEEKYDKLIGEINDIQERLEHQKEKFFKYD